MVTSPATLAANLKGFRKGRGLLASTGYHGGMVEYTAYCCLGVACEIIGIDRPLIEGEALPSALAFDLRDEFDDAYPWMKMKLPDDHTQWSEWDTILTLLVNANDNNDSWDDEVIPLLEYVEANFDKLLP